MTSLCWLLKDVPTGELPRNLLLSVDRHLVQTVVPGSRLTIVGIYSIFQASNSSTSWVNHLFSASSDFFFDQSTIFWDQSTVDVNIFKLCVLCSNKGAVAVRQPYIRVVGIEDGNEAKSRGPTAFTNEEVSVHQLSVDYFCALYLVGCLL